MQVTSNLIDNAVKYSPGNGRIIIGLNCADGFGELTIRDDGPGVPREMRNYIFERFRQVPSTPGAQGFGLGLAICKQIVEKHGGSIGVRNTASQSGNGCEFWVKFKLYDERSGNCPSY
jgi:signal transduction histidine kinase